MGVSSGIRVCRGRGGSSVQFWMVGDKAIRTHKADLNCLKQRLAQGVLELCGEPTRVSDGRCEQGVGQRVPNILE